MFKRSINVKVMKETGNKVIVRFVSLNRQMPVPREEFEARVESGEYNVLNADDAQAVK